MITIYQNIFDYHLMKWPVYKFLTAIDSEHWCGCRIRCEVDPIVLTGKYQILPFITSMK